MRHIAVATVVLALAAGVTSAAPGDGPPPRATSAAGRLLAVDATIERIDWLIGQVT